jgi:hypothetical protein
VAGAECRGPGALLVHARSGASVRGLACECVCVCVCLCVLLAVTQPRGWCAHGVHDGTRERLSHTLVAVAQSKSSTIIRMRGLRALLSALQVARLMYSSCIF